MAQSDAAPVVLSTPNPPPPHILKRKIGMSGDLHNPLSATTSNPPFPKTAPVPRVPFPFGGGGPVQVLLLALGPPPPKGILLQVLRSRRERLWGENGVCGSPAIHMGGDELGREIRFFQNRIGTARLHVFRKACVMRFPSQSFHQSDTQA